MSQDFAGQKLITIGGTSGIGKAVARIILERGGSAVLVGRREKKLQAAVDELKAYGLLSESAPTLAILRSVKP